MPCKSAAIGRAVAKRSAPKAVNRLQFPFPHENHPTFFQPRAERRTRITKQTGNSLQTPSITSPQTPVLRYAEGPDFPRRATMQLSPHFLHRVCTHSLRSPSGGAAAASPRYFAFSSEVP
jgi:hypothetical protein